MTGGLGAVAVVLFAMAVLPASRREPVALPANDSVEAIPGPSFEASKAEPPS
jgi:hypothetical protein